MVENEIGMDSSYIIVTVWDPISRFVANSTKVSCRF